MLTRAPWSLVLLLLPGCSLIFVNGPPEGHEQLRYFDCVSNGGAAAGDVSWAVADALLAASLASADGDVDDNGDKLETSTPAALFGVAAAVHAGSLIYGLIQTHRCSDAKQHLQQRLADQDAEQKRLVEQLRQQVQTLQAQSAPPPAPAAPSTLQLEPGSAAPVAPGAVPAPPATPAQPAATPPAQSAVPPPPDAYKQPGPAQP
jgi:hypothetical protein